MQRKETFATSGPMMKVRFFGSFDYAADDVAKPDFLKLAYAKGVPMGGDLKPGAGKAPTFLVTAIKDPKSGNLDRIQIVKGWLDAAGKQHEKIYDVAWSGERKIGADGKLPAVGDSVDLKTATYTDAIGAARTRHRPGPIPSSIPASAPSTTPASSRSRPRAGTPTTRRARAWRR